MKDIDIFLNKLYKLTDELEKLGREFSDLYRKYDGTDFENQNYLAADKLDNSILAVTHEMATTIGFMGIDIKMLTNYIDFRKEYKELTDEELEVIIDSYTIDLKFKLVLDTRLTNGDTKLLLDKIHAVRHSWNKTFDNKKYQYISNHLTKN